MTVLSTPVSTQAELDAAIAVARERGRELQHAHPSLRANAQIVLAAVTSDPWALEYADNDLRADPNIVLVAVKRVGFALKYAAESVQGDRQVVLAAVKQVGTAVKFATLALRKDRDVAIAAVTQTGWALTWVHDDLKDDPEVVQKAIQNAPGSMWYASKRLQADMKCLALSIHFAGPDFLLKETMIFAHRVRAAAEVGRIETWLMDWRSMQMFLMGMHHVQDNCGGGGSGGGGGGGGGKRQSVRPQRALGRLHVGEAVLARRIGAYLGMPGRFEGTPGLSVVAVYRGVVATTPEWARFPWTIASLCSLQQSRRRVYPTNAERSDDEGSADEGEL